MEKINDHERKEKAKFEFYRRIIKYLKANKKIIGFITAGVVLEIIFTYLVFTSVIQFGVNNKNQTVIPSIAPTVSPKPLAKKYYLSVTDSNSKNLRYPLPENLLNPFLFQNGTDELFIVGDSEIYKYSKGEITKKYSVSDSKFIIKGIQEINGNYFIHEETDQQMQFVQLDKQFMFVTIFKHSIKPFIFSGIKIVDFENDWIITELQYAEATTFGAEYHKITKDGAVILLLKIHGSGEDESGSDNIGYDDDLNTIYYAEFRKSGLQPNLSYKSIINDIYEFNIENGIKKRLFSLNEGGDFKYIKQSKSIFLASEANNLIIKIIGVPDGLTKQQKDFGNYRTVGGSDSELFIEKRDEVGTNNKYIMDINTLQIKNVKDINRSLKSISEGTAQLVKE